MEIIWTEFAILELKKIHDWYKINASFEIAAKIKNSIFDATRTLKHQPYSGQIEENLISLKENHRYIVQGNYKIIYILTENSVFITDVFDCRQNPKKMKRFRI